MLKTVLCHLQQNCYKFVRKVLSDHCGSLYCTLRSAKYCSQSRSIITLTLTASRNLQLFTFNMNVLNPEMDTSDLTHLQKLGTGLFADENNTNLAQAGCARDSDHEQNSKSDTETFGLSTLFEMEKVVDHVKIKIKEKREEGKMQQNVFHSNKQENDGNKWKKEKRTKQSEQCSLEGDKLDGDSSFGLTSLFEQKKIVHNRRRRNVKKVNKIVKRIKEDDSFGLRMLFSEKNNSNKRNKQKSRKRKDETGIEEEVSETATEEEKSEINAKKKRPSHFVAIRISDPKIHQAIKDFQDTVLKENEKLKPALIPLVSLHITMAVMHLDETVVTTAQSALQKCKVKIMEALRTVNFKLTFSGVGNFKNEVVFANIAEKDQIDCLNTINSVITATFEEDGISLSDKKEWKPHLTLLKLSRKRSLRKSGIKKVELDVYASWIQRCFGEELVENVHLCSMLGSKEDDGFYKCLSTITFPGNNSESDIGESSVSDK